MTVRLYLDDPYLDRFEAALVQVRDRGGRPAAVLDRSAFYPEGGGQPSDRGTLGGVPVLDVVEDGGEVLHVLGGPAPQVGGTVVGQVDWARRFDHMQQHHGQHLLSASFERLFGARTVSFHLGEEACTIDLDRPPAEVGPERLRAAEARANELVWRDLPVTARDHAPDELARLPLRKEALKGARVVVVRDDRGGLEILDASPCGGTHPRRTGEVGAVAVLGAEKWGAGTRVAFACGGRVVGLLRAAREGLADASRALRCAPPELPGAVARLVEESLARRKEADRLVAALAAAEAERLARACPAPRPATAELAPPLASPPAMRAVAVELAARGRTALLGAVEGGRAHLCFARPKGPGPHLGEVLRAAAALAGGKGGGSPDLAQGSVPDIAALRRLLDSAAGSIEDPRT